MDVSNFSLFYHNLTAQIKNWSKWRHFQNKRSKWTNNPFSFFFIFACQLKFYFIYFFTCFHHHHHHFFSGFSSFVWFWWDKIKRNSISPQQKCFVSYAYTLRTILSVLYDTGNQVTPTGCRSLGFKLIQDILFQVKFSIFPITHNGQFFLPVSCSTFRNSC